MNRKKVAFLLVCIPVLISAVAHSVSQPGDQTYSVRLEGPIVSPFVMQAQGRTYVLMTNGPNAPNEQSHLFYDVRSLSDNANPASDLRGLITLNQRPADVTGSGHLDLIGRSLEMPTTVIADALTPNERKILIPQPLGHAIANHMSFRSDVVDVDGDGVKDVSYVYNGRYSLVSFGDRTDPYAEFTVIQNSQDESIFVGTICTGSLGGEFHQLQEYSWEDQRGNQYHDYVLTYVPLDVMKERPDTVMSIIKARLRVTRAPYELVIVTSEDRWSLPAASSTPGIDSILAVTAQGLELVEAHPSYRLPSGGQLSQSGVYGAGRYQVTRGVRIADTNAFLYVEQELREDEFIHTTIHVHRIEDADQLELKHLRTFKLQPTYSDVGGIRSVLAIPDVDGDGIPEVVANHDGKLDRDEPETTWLEVFFSGDAPTNVEEDVLDRNKRLEFDVLRINRHTWVVTSPHNSDQMPRVYDVTGAVVQSDVKRIDPRGDHSQFEVSIPSHLLNGPLWLAVEASAVRLR